MAFFNKWKSTSKGTDKPERAASKQRGEGTKNVISKVGNTRNKIKTPFEIPSDFQNKLSKSIKSLPGWGKRPYIGFGKRTDQMSAVIISFPVTAQEAMDFDGVLQIIDDLHSNMPDNQGIIAVRSGFTKNGNKYIYILKKVNMRTDNGMPLGMDYELNFNIKLNGEIQFLQGSFQEIGTTGMRDTTVYILAKNEKLIGDDFEEWYEDPYDPDFKKGICMNISEKDKYDAMFPNHPLSQARYFINYLIENN